MKRKARRKNKKSEDGLHKPKKETIGSLLKAARTVETKDQKEAIAEWRQIARSLSAKKWKRQVDKIKDNSVQIAVACIVWYDYFSLETVHGKQTFLFDDLVDKWEFRSMPSDKEIVKGLVAVGYPRAVAETRIQVYEFETQKGNSRKWNTEQ